MDFDKFLEKDIIEFLDEQAVVVAEKVANLREEEFDLYEITQDYSKEISNALKERDLRKAQKVFEDVKSKYLKAPETSLSKKRLYIILEEIYEKMKDYQAKEEGKKSLFETIRDYEEKGLFTRPELFQKKRAEGANLILSSIDKKEKELEKLTTKKPVREEDLKEAIKRYREMKELIKRVPDTYQKEKSKVYDSALCWYYSIKKLKEGFGEKEEVREIKETRPEEPVEKKLAETRKLKEEIIESHKTIVEFVKNKKVNKSIREYRHLKELLGKFPHEMEEEKTALLADALSLYESIKKLKQILVQKQIIELTRKKEEEKEKKELEARKKEIYESLKKIKELITKKDILNMIKEYKKLKEIFKQYPEHPAEEKKKIYKEILATYKDIELLEDNLKKKKEIYENLKKIKELITKKDILNMIKEYKKLKEIFKQYPEHPAEEKKKIYKEILATYKDIELLEDNLKKKLLSYTQEKVLNINKILEETYLLLDRDLVEQANHNLLEAKHRIQILPKEAFDEKYKLLKEIEKLEHKLLFVKNTQRINTLDIIAHKL